MVVCRCGVIEVVDRLNEVGKSVAAGFKPSLD